MNQHGWSPLSNNTLLENPNFWIQNLMENTDGFKAFLILNLMNPIPNLMNPIFGFAAHYLGGENLLKDLRIHIYIYTHT